MRIAIVSEWFSEKMGYAENCLPKALASFGHEVHLVTSNVQVYFNSPNYKTTYEPFIGPNIVPCEVRELDGYTLHRLPHLLRRRRVRIKGLRQELAALRPDIVQTFDANSPTTLEIAIGKAILGYRLFLESHVHASVYPLAAKRDMSINRLRVHARAATVGRLINAMTELCYPISTDAAEIVRDYFGIDPRKIKVVPLGTDTDLFHPLSEPTQREQLRRKLGFAPSDIVCIYTGRFSEDKDPLCLAQAIDTLAKQGKPFRGLFVGSGSAKQIEAIQACSGCVVQGFVPVHELPPYYWAADIGVWPKQESTSQLDAAACGLPLILSNRIQVTERIEGNGLLYEENDYNDLARQILSLSDLKLRQGMAEIGAKKVLENFSWIHIANERLIDYCAALEAGK